MGVGGVYHQLQQTDEKRGEKGEREWERVGESGRGGSECPARELLLLTGTGKGRWNDQQQRTTVNHLGGKGKRVWHERKTRVARPPHPPTHPRTLATRFRPVEPYRSTSRVPSSVALWSEGREFRRRQQKGKDNEVNIPNLHHRPSPLKSTASTHTCVVEASGNQKGGRWGVCGS